MFRGIRNVTLKDCVNVGTEQPWQWSCGREMVSYSPDPTTQCVGPHLKPEEPGMELGAWKVFLQRRAVERRC